MNNNFPQRPTRPTHAEIGLPNSDPGYYYDPNVVAGQHGEIRLSPRVEAICKCGGRPPYQIYERPDAEPIWCPCRPYRLRIRQVNRLIAESGIPERFRYKFLDDFYEGYGGQPIPGATRLKEYLRSLIDRHVEARSRQTAHAQGAPQPSPSNPAPPPRGFLLWGKPGNGKTLFACVVLNELIFHACRPGRFIGLSRKFFQTLRHTFDEDSPIHGQAMPILETLSTVPFLVIDDFGVQRNTEWEIEMLYNLVDARYADQRFTVVTTNQGIEDIKGLAAGRIYSRFLEMCYIIHVQAPDYREYAKKEYEV